MSHIAARPKLDIYVRYHGVGCSLVLLPWGRPHVPLSPDPWQPTDGRDDDAGQKVAVRRDNKGEGREDVVKHNKKYDATLNSGT